MSTLAFLYFIVCLVAIALIDLKWMLIPTALVYPTAALGLVSALLEPSIELSGPWLWQMIAPVFGPHAVSLAGAMAGLFLGWGLLKGISWGYRAMRGYDGLGDGDPPLLGMIGAFLGWRAIPVILLASALIGLLSFSLIILISKKTPTDSWATKPLPFGPPLVLASFFYLLFGQECLRWYFSLISL